MQSVQDPTTTKKKNLKMSRDIYVSGVCFSF
jgi:hypothetical protein